MKSNCKKLDKAQNVTLCAIFPVWRTTPTIVLQKEVATPFIYHMLDYLCELAALYLYKLKVQHYFCIQTKQAHTIANPSRLERLARICLNKIEYLDLLHELELWEKHLFDFDSCLVATGGISNKEKTTIKFNSWLKSQKPLNIIVYTNGSQEVDQNNISISTWAR